jgi:ElaB/YqjD/DUF883 family membrane-anchored ribosome-binding protein
MENSVTSGYAKTGATARDAGNVLSSKLEDVRSDAGTAVRTGTRRIQSMGKQGLDAITDAVGQARDIASDASDSVVAYTKKNPFTALAIAAASGALLYAAVKALLPSRD